MERLGSLGIVVSNSHDAESINNRDVDPQGSLSTTGPLAGAFLAWQHAKFLPTLHGIRKGEKANLGFAHTVREELWV